MNSDLLETILWDNGYQRLAKHLQRLANSADYFGYPYDLAKIQDALDEARNQIHLTANDQSPITREKYKVRLKLKPTGQWLIEAISIQEALSVSPPIVVLSQEHTNSRDQMYYHKTTDRALYDQASRFAQENGYADVLFLNEKDEVTEGAISNIFIERDGHLLTPPVHCGLLNGIYRQSLLQENPCTREAVLHLEDLLTAEKIYICNAIRGLREVKLMEHDLWQLLT